MSKLNDIRFYNTHKHFLRAKFTHRLGLLTNSIMIDMGKTLNHYHICNENISGKEYSLVKMYEIKTLSH